MKWGPLNTYFCSAPDFVFLQGNVIDVFLCDTAGFTKEYNHRNYDDLVRDGLKFQCQHFRLTNWANVTCPSLSLPTNATCLSIQSCEQSVEGPVVLFIIWIIALILVWCLTEPYMCAVLQRCFTRFSLNAHYLRYRTAHFWLAVMVFDLPVCLYSCYLVWHRVGKVSTNLYAILTLFGLSFAANTLDVCIQTWNDDPPELKQVEFASDLMKPDTPGATSTVEGDSDSKPHDLKDKTANPLRAV